MGREQAFMCPGEPQAWAGVGIWAGPQAASAEHVSGLCQGRGQKLLEDAGRGEGVFTGSGLQGLPTG